MSAASHFDPANIPTSQTSLLIQLYSTLTDYSTPYNTPADEIIEKLGFGPEVTHAIYNDMKYNRQVVESLKNTLTVLRAKSQRYIAPQDIYIRDELYSGKLNPVNLFILKNPFVVADLEKFYELPQTGDADLFQKHWNIIHYSPARCSEFNDVKTCLIKAAQDGDLETFKKLAPGYEINDLLKEAIIMSAIENGHINILEYLVSTYGDLLPAKAGGFLGFAGNRSHDNTAMIQYLWDTLPDHKPFSKIDLTSALFNGHIKNFWLMLKLNEHVVHSEGMRKMYRYLIPRVEYIRKWDISAELNRRLAAIP